jgi:hypothetical protein
MSRDISKKSPSRNPEEICQQSSGLNDILKKATWLNQLNSTIKKHLPASLQPHVIVANYRDHCLVLGVKKSAFLTELRYREGILLESLQKKDLPQLKSIECIILLEEK